MSDQEKAWAVVKAQSPEVRAAFAFVVQTAFVSSKCTGTDDSGSEIYEDDADATLTQVAKNIRDAK